MTWILPLSNWSGTLSTCRSGGASLHPDSWSSCSERYCEVDLEIERVSFRKEHEILIEHKCTNIQIGLLSHATTIISFLALIRRRPLDYNLCISKQALETKFFKLWEISALNPKQSLRSKSVCFFEACFPCAGKWGGGWAETVRHHQTATTHQCFHPESVSPFVQIC